MRLRLNWLGLLAGPVLAWSVMAQVPAQPSYPYPPGQPGSQPRTPDPQDQPGSQRRTRPGINPDASPTPGQTTQQSVESMPKSDKKFVKEVAEGSRTEIELGKLAHEKASGEVVKDFAKRLVEDHSKASKALEEAAAKANIQVPTEIQRKAQKAHEKLSKLSGAEFDRAFAKLMVKEHKNDVEAFEKQSRTGESPEIRAFAANTLPTIQEHLRLAEQLEIATKRTTDSNKQVESGASK